MEAAILTNESTDPEAATEPSPAEVFRAVRDRPGVVFLDGRAGLARAPWSLLAWAPQSVLRIDSDDSDAPDCADRGARAADPMRAIDDFLERESAAGRTVMGAVAYELGRSIEPRAGIRKLGKIPLVRLASYDQAYAYDHRVRRWSSRLPTLAPSRAPRCRVGPLRARTGWRSYLESFERARAWIAAGDVYQVNLSIGFEAAFDGEAAALFERIAKAHAAPYAAYLDAGDFQLLSISPELFLERRGHRLSTRPIKGTRPRGDEPADDARLRGELLIDAKERAEHVMIVDLERNDLGRVAETGSVRTEDLWSIETYPGLHHLESTVSARLRGGLRLCDILRATFPSGSITGAPKLRAMQIIDVLEDTPRGFYTGGILYHRPDGDFTMSVAIRTATVTKDLVHYRAGGGLVWDSTPSEEYAECMLKARAFIEATKPS